MPRELKLNDPVYREFIELSTRALLEQVSTAVKANKPGDVVHIVRAGIERAYIAGHNDAQRPVEPPEVRVVGAPPEVGEPVAFEGTIVDGRPVRV